MHGKLFIVFIISPLIFALGACSSFSKRMEQSEPPPISATGTTSAGANNSDAAAKSIAALNNSPVQKTTGDANMPQIRLLDKNGKVVTAPATLTAKDGKPLTKVELSPTEIAEDKIAKQTLASPGTVKAAHATISAANPHARHPGPVSADKALGWLKNGNKRFVKGNLRNDGVSIKDRARLAGGQQPHTVVLSCSDSRVPPELLFDEKLGEIFIVRVAGESLDASSIGSIEYAVEHLGTNLVLVLGHESCGAVKAAIGTLDGSGLGSPALNKMIADLRPRLQQFKNTTPSKGYLAESWANVEGVAQDLLERSEIVRDAVGSGEVKVSRAVYHLDSGQVEWH